MRRGRIRRSPALHARSIRRRHERELGDR
jgi:hypothetical protein